MTVAVERPPRLDRSVDADNDARGGAGRVGRVGWVGAALVAVVAVVAVLAPAIAPYRAFELSGRPLEAPSADHLLGTNGVGMDVFTQLVLGARSSLLIAVLAGVGTLAVGAGIGLLAGWLGGWFDALAMRLVDIVLALPRLPLLILMGVYLGPTLTTTALVISLAFWPPTARIVRSQVLTLRHRTHLTAAVGFGAGTAHTLRRHVIPEIGLVLAASLVASAGRAVMLEAGLAFLGLGDPSRVSWGSILRDALDFNALFFTDAWRWWLLPPIAALVLFLLGLTLLGMAVEGWVNPRLGRHPGGAGS
jgi:ABC-type dipeptide/oligopeptide/nickel transport system permease subunit